VGKFCNYWFFSSAVVEITVDPLALLWHNSVIESGQQENEMKLTKLEQAAQDYADAHYSWKPAVVTAANVDWLAPLTPAANPLAYKGSLI